MPLGSASQLIKRCSQADKRKRRESLVTGSERGPVFYFSAPWDKELSALVCAERTIDGSSIEAAETYRPAEKDVMYLIGKLCGQYVRTGYSSLYFLPNALAW